MTPTQKKAMDLEDLKDRLVAISDAIVNQDDREAQAIIRTTLAALAEHSATPQHPIVFCEAPKCIGTAKTCTGPCSHIDR